MNSRLHSERGSALLITLTIMALLTLAALTAVKTSDTDVDLSFNQLHADQALYIAEAGVQRSIAILGENKWWNSGFDSIDVGDGYFHVDAVDFTIDSTLGDTIVVTSSGFNRDAEAQIEAWITFEFIPSFQYAAFGDQGFRIDQGGCTDSYNSDSGTVAATLDTLGGDIGINSGTIKLSGGATVGGDANGGAGSTFDLSGGSYVKGDTSTTAPTKTIDTVSDATFAYMESVSKAPAGFVVSNLVQYNGGSKDLYVKKLGLLTLSSGFYYFNSITMERDAVIDLAPGATVYIYVQGDILIGQRSLFNVPGKTTDLVVISKGSTVLFNQDAQFAGALLAWNADFVANQSGELYGSFITKTFGMDQAACLHYDRALNRIAVPRAGKPQLYAWKEIE